MSRSVIPVSLLVVSGAIALAALVSCLLVVFVGVPPVWGVPERRAARSGIPMRPNSE